MAKAGTWLGNPYPCAIDWGTDNVPVSGWTKTNIDKSIYYWDGANAQYAVFNSSGAGAGTNSATNIIPSAQGFFIHVTTGQASGTLSADNRVRLHSLQAFWKNTPEEVTDQLRLKVVGNNHQDEIIVRFVPGADPGFDSDYDSYKKFGDPSAPQLYSVTPNNIDVSINTLPEITQHLLVPVGFSLGVNEQNVLTASQLNTFNPRITILLEDKKLNQFQDLRANPEYVFNADTADVPSRFVLHFSDPFSGTGDKQADPLVRIYSYDNIICIDNQDSQHLSGKMYLYDLLGRELFQHTLEGNLLEKINVDLGTGYYLVRVVTSRNTCTQKVFINRR
jgi:hypothetical protein